ncbi:MAG: hypothetical protein ABF633_03195 [Clostridium sp.]|uniref:hypothetical protein n=1 Tax=Clostridium sp. TaxID=1506 RepID=UPI0039E9E0AB
MADEKVNINVEADTEQATSAFDRLKKSMSNLGDTIKKNTAESANSFNNMMNNIGKSIQNGSEKLNKFGKGTQQLGQDLSSAGQKIALSVSTPLLAIGKQVIEQGSNMQAFEATYKQSMKGMASVGDAFAKSYSNVAGITENQVRRQILSFNQYGKSMGFSQEEALNFSEKMVQLTNDLGAFTDVPFDEATDRMKSALMGNYEAVDKLGLSFGEATIKQEMMKEGLKGQFSDLKETQKLNLLYNLAVRQGADAMGQAGRESGQYQAKMMKLKGVLQDLAKQVFDVIAPSVTDTLQKLTDFLKRLQQLSPEQIKFYVNIAKWAIILPIATTYLGYLIEAIGRLIVVSSGAMRGIGWIVANIGLLPTAIGVWALNIQKYALIVVGAFKTLATGIATAMKATFSAVFSPVGLIILAIVGIAVAVYFIVKYWDEIKAYTQQAWSAIRDFFGQLWTDIVAIFDQAKTAIQPIIDAIGAVITSIFTKYILPFYTQYIKPFVDTIIYLAQIIYYGLSVIAMAIGVVLAPVVAIISVIAKIIFVAIMIVVDVFKVLWQVIVFVANLIGVILGVLATAFLVVFGIISTIVLAVGKVIWWVISGIIVPILEFLMIIFAIIFVQVLKGWWNAIKIIFGYVMDYIKVMASVFMWLWNNAINPALQWIVQGLKWLYGIFALIFAQMAQNAIAFGNGVLSVYNKYVKPFFDWILSGLKTLNSNWNSIWRGFGSVVSDVVGTIRRAWDSIIGAFKLPHFKVNGDFSIMPPKVPSFSVDWHAKGGIFNKPTLLGNGSHGVGEAGAEAVLPLTSAVLGGIGQGIAEVMPDNTGGDDNGGGGGAVITGNNFYIREEADIKKTAQELYRLERQNQRGRGRR